MKPADLIAVWRTRANRFNSQAKDWRRCEDGETPTEDMGMADHYESIAEHIETCAIELEKLK